MVLQMFKCFQSRLGIGYKPYSFWLNMLDAVYQSLVIFFVAKAAYTDSNVDIWEFGTTITTSCLYTMLVHGAIEIKSWVRIISNCIIYYLSLISNLQF